MQNGLAARKKGTSIDLAETAEAGVVGKVKVIKDRTPDARVY